MLTTNKQRTSSWLYNQSIIFHYRPGRKTFVLNNSIIHCVILIFEIFLRIFNEFLTKMLYTLWCGLSRFFSIGGSTAESTADHGKIKFESYSFKIYYRENYKWAYVTNDYQEPTLIYHLRTSTQDTCLKLVVTKIYQKKNSEQVDFFKFWLKIFV